METKTSSITSIFCVKILSDPVCVVVNFSSQRCQSIIVEIILSNLNERHCVIPALEYIRKFSAVNLF